jgi:hypothetical protein
MTLKSSRKRHFSIQYQPKNLPHLLFSFSQLYQLHKTKITRFTRPTDEKNNNNINNQTTPNSILKNVFDGTKQQQNQNCNIIVQKKFKNQIKFHHHFVTEQIKLMNSQNLYRISVTKLYILSSTFYFTYLFLIFTLPGNPC